MPHGSPYAVSFLAVCFGIAANEFCPQKAIITLDTRSMPHPQPLGIQKLPSTYKILLWNMTTRQHHGLGLRVNTESRGNNGHLLLSLRPNLKLSRVAFWLIHKYRTQISGTLMLYKRTVLKPTSLKVS